MIQTNCGNADLWTGDCAYLPEQYDSGVGQLMIFSTPYPGLLGFDLNVQDYFDYWLPKRLGSLIDMINEDTGVIIQNLWLPRTEEGFYDPQLFRLIKIYQIFGFNLIEPYIWDKKNAPPAGNMNRHDRNEWEFFFAFSRNYAYTYNKFRQPYAEKTIGKAKSGNMRKPDLNGQLAGGHADLHPDGAAQSNILRYSASGDQNRPRIKDRVFPLKMIERLVLQYSDPEDTVIDPFCGTGTTLLAAVKNERKAIGCDISAENIDEANLWLSRWQFTE